MISRRTLVVALPALLAGGLPALAKSRHPVQMFDTDGDGTIDLAEAKKLSPGDLYELLPENDIHRVRTTSEVASISLHLLGNNNGCIWRHQFRPEERAVKPFKSGWLNVPCDEEDPMD